MAPFDCIFAQISGLNISSSQFYKNDADDYLGIQN